ncbi:Cyclic nucleotide-binding protein [Pseudocohnilembus persalinus]|uniref:Cyclic nucleotide-binding protein n=1 Tax=Pseudocohnilembus persalinus TaxID=266149 RepID=A0A0V0R2F6_PSEPJ|nr:Cyclic nucleotide-binding protein [Pseudocohnilembus persalinus]|eukprot:KRX08373.1 Cyclic nucleotide-binding protein [Pseudocohnilembus persalinus]
MSLQNIVAEFNNNYQLEQKYNATYELVRLIFIIFIVAHYTALAFYYVAHIEIQYNQNDTWIQQKQMEASQWYIKYIEALYFSFITMSTVGYGDISPSTQQEKILVIILTLISCGIFAYAINTIGSIFRDKQLKNASIKKKKYEISKYMIKRNINKKSQLMALKALEYMEHQQDNGNIEGLQVLNTIPQSISSKNLFNLIISYIQIKFQEEIFIDFYGRVLGKSKFFRQGGFSEQILKELSATMKEITVGPGTKIFEQGKLNPNLYFLIEGSLQIKCSNRNQSNSQQFKEQKISVISGNQEIDIKNFYLQFPSQYTIQSKNVSRLVYLEFSNFYQIIKDSPKDYQNFCKIKDDIAFNKIRLPNKCFICQNWSLK